LVFSKLNIEAGKKGNEGKHLVRLKTKVHYHESRLRKKPESMLLNFVYWRTRLLEGILRDRHENDDGEKKRRNGTTVKARRARCRKTLALMEMANIAGCSEPRPDCPPIIRR